MPYIKQEFREELIDGIRNPETVGEINYLITTICNTYLEYVGTDYSKVNEVIGALECAKLEFYRRIAAPYEDIKIKENGDVYSV